MESTRRNTPGLLVLESNVQPILLPFLHLLFLFGVESNVLYSIIIYDKQKKNTGSNLWH